MNWRDTIVAIYTPIAASKPMGKVGTGIPVGQDLVLTALHVVRPKEGRSSDPIKIFHWHKKGDDRCVTNIADSDLIVWACETHDVALLRCPTPPHAGLAVIEKDRRPRAGDRWCSTGFPAAAMVGKMRDPSDFIGDVNPAADSKTYFEVLAAIEKSPAGRDGWKGASGMPVVVNDRIIGVCVEIPSGFGNCTIRAAPIWRLWDNASFREFFRPPIKIEAFTNRLAKTLEKLFAIEKARAAINDVLTDKASLATGYAQERDEHRIAAALMDVEGRILLDTMFELMNIVVPSFSSLLTVVQEMSAVVAPVIFGLNNNLASEYHRRIEGGTGFLSVDGVGTATMAELLMAAAENRPADFTARRFEDDPPPGRRWVPIEFEVGNDDGKRFLRSIKIELNRSVGNVPHREKIEAQASLDGIRNFIAASAKLDPDLAMLNAQLTVRRQRGLPLPYLAFPLPPNESARDHLFVLLDQLRQAMPLLNIICLSKDHGPDEFVRLAGLHFLIPLAEA